MYEIKAKGIANPRFRMSRKGKVMEEDHGQWGRGGVSSGLSKF